MVEKIENWGGSESDEKRQNKLNFKNFQKTLDKARITCYNVEANPKTAGFGNCA